jgi:hypothetical protein
MTIEEIIKNAQWDESWGFGYHTHKELVALCQEVRRLTIEECKKKVQSDYSMRSCGLIDTIIDLNSFPTDLNKIDL